jgi:MFS family permease
MKYSRTVILLSLVSLFTDMASEMLYPVMPAYLRQIGFSVLLIGILEGVAEAVAGLSKSYFGGLSDRSGKRLPFVQLGYALSALSKPMMALLTQAWWVFIARTTDRLGKGLRTGARDAMLSQEAGAENKGTVFGFHRAMDTLGAVFGPLLALLFLHYYPGQYTWLFLLAIVPGVLAILATWLLREKPSGSSVNRRVTLMHAFRYWKESPGDYRRLVAGLLFFAMLNSSDLLLLLRMREGGYTDQQVIGVYIFYNLCYALLAWPAGMLADRLGMRRVYVAGLLLFALTYAGFSAGAGFYGYLLLWFCYGAYAACTEGVAKAWISGTIPATETASAIGTYTGFQSIAALLSSSLAGLAWHVFGPAWAFGLTAAGTIIVAIYIARFAAASAPS